MIREMAYGQKDLRLNSLDAASQNLAAKLSARLDKKSIDLQRNKLMPRFRREIDEVIVNRSRNNGSKTQQEQYSKS
jgi:hypothetical protein